MTDATIPAPAGTPPGRRSGWVVGVLFAAAGGAAGWFSTTPLYKSAGWIEVLPALPKVLYDSEASRPMPRFRVFLDSQCALAASERVADLAMDSPEWKKLGRPRAEEAERFRGRLRVRRRPSTDYLEVSFRDEDPAAAVTGADAVLDAYMRLVSEQETMASSGTVKVLENKRQVLNNQVTDLRMTIQQVTDDFGPEGLDARWAQALSEFLAREREASGPGAGPAKAELREQAAESLRRLAKKRAQVQQLETERVWVAAQLAQVRARLDELNVESQGAVLGRIRIAALADLPAAPYVDRRLRYALLGATGALVVRWVLAGLFRRRSAG